MENRTLVDRLARDLKRPKKDINNLLEALALVVGERCADLDSLAIPGFGSFKGEKREEEVINDNGTLTLMPPRVKVKFTLSNVLKNKISRAR